MRYPCKYNVVRFQPYVETEEFVNIGVILCSVETNEFFFKLLPATHTRRVTAFFDLLDINIFRTAIQIARQELTSLKKIIEDKNHLEAYENVVAPTNDIIQYSNIRYIATENPEMALDKLFEDYVQRVFIHDQGYEEKMQQRIRSWFMKTSLNQQYKERKLGQDYFQVLLPFVSDKDQPKVIKPIHFMHPNSKKLMDHGLTWLYNMEQLYRHKLAIPEKTLFAYKAPDQKNGLLKDAFEDVKFQIESKGILMIPSDEADPILEFARSS